LRYFIKRTMEQSQLLFTLINNNKRKEFLESEPKVDKFNTIFKDNGLNDVYKTLFIQHITIAKELSYQNIYQLLQCPEFIDRYLSLPCFTMFTNKFDLEKSIFYQICNKPTGLIVQVLGKQILRNKKLKKNFIDWIHAVIQHNYAKKQTISLINPLINQSLMDDKILINLGYMLQLLMNDAIKNHNKTLSFGYFGGEFPEEWNKILWKDDECIQLENNELDEDHAIEFVDQLFIYIHRLYELSIANMYERQKKFNIELRELNESIEIENHSCRWNLRPATDKTLVVDRLIAKRDNAKSKIDSIIQTIVASNFQYKMMEFYELTSKSVPIDMLDKLPITFYHTPIKMYSMILKNSIYFVPFTKPCYNFCMKLLKNKSIENFYQIFDILTVLTANKIEDLELFGIIMKNWIDINKYKKDDYEIIQSMYQNLSYSIIDRDNLMVKYLDDNPEIIEKIMFIMISDINRGFEHLIEYMNRINILEKTLSTPIDINRKLKLEDKIYLYYHKTQHIFKDLEQIFSYLHSITKEHPINTILMSKITLGINDYVVKYPKLLLIEKTFVKKFGKINNSDINKCIVNYYKLLSVNTDFIEYLAYNPDIFSREHFIELGNAWINDLIGMVDSVEVEEEEDIPDEFLDPIMFCPIKNPVVLPESKTVMERDIIVQHLMDDETDPFNRTTLTIKMLNDYCESEEGQVLIKEFNDKLECWKKNKKV
jgi:hypothetical protein